MLEVPICLPWHTVKINKVNLKIVRQNHVIQAVAPAVVRESMPGLAAMRAKRVASATIKVAPEIGAKIPSGAPENAVRIVTKNDRKLKFTGQGVEVR
jgi:hypothetical protein